MQRPHNRCPAQVRQLPFYHQNEVDAIKLQILMPRFGCLRPKQEDILGLSSEEEAPTAYQAGLITNGLVSSQAMYVRQVGTTHRNNI